MARNAPDLQLVSLPRLARELGMHPDTLRGKVRRGEGPPVVNFGTSLLFRISTVRRWLAENEGNPAPVKRPQCRSVSERKPRT